jgi:polysaccharide biosynthesis protein PslG
VRSLRWTLVGAALLAAAAGLAPPALAISHAPPSFYGAVAEGPLGTVHQRPAVLRAELDRIARAGGGSVRVSVWWSAMQRHRRDPVDWRSVDRVVVGAATRHLTVLPVIQSSPCWAAVRPCEVNARPRDMRAFGRFLRQLASRYGPGGTAWKGHPGAVPVRRWQIWNEPQFRGFWSGPDWPATYTRALATARASLRRVDPRAQVVMAGLSNFSWRDLAQLYRAGARPYFDVAAVQTFTSRPTNVLAAVKLVRRVMASNGDAAKPLMMTEVAWAAPGRRAGLGLRAIQVDSRTQARNLEAVYALAEAARDALHIDAVFWASWITGYRRPDRVFDYTGLRRYDSRTGRATSMPALRAFRRVARAGG